MSIASEITRLSGVRDDIFTSITNKGVTVPVGSTFSSCPTLIDSIVTGGGGGDPTSLINPTFTASGYTSGYRPFTATQTPVANPTYLEISAYPGAPFQNQMSFFTIFGLKQDLWVMADYYDVYKVPSYLILTMSASASSPQGQLSVLYSQFMSDNFFNNSRIFLVGNNQNTYITTAVYTSQKYGYKEFAPNDTYNPSAVYLSAIADLSPIVNDPYLFEYETPSSTIYGDGFSLSFEGCSQLLYDFPNWIRKYGGSIVSSISACASVTTAYPYPSYPSATTGTQEWRWNGREYFYDDGTSMFPCFATSGHGVTHYDNGPADKEFTYGEPSTASQIQDQYFSAGKLKNTINFLFEEIKPDVDLRYSYTYGTTISAYSGFEGV